MTLGACIKKFFSRINMKKTNFYLITLLVLVLFIVLIHPEINYFQKRVVKGVILAPIMASLLFITIMKTAPLNKAIGYKKYLSDISAGIYFTHLYLVLRYYPFIKEEYNIINLPFLIILCVILTFFLILINKKVKYLL